MFEILDEVIRDFKSHGLFPESVTFQSSSTNPSVKVGGRNVLMFGSNNYLGLANDPEVIEKAANILREHGAGPGGSRLLSGNLEFIEEFEKVLARFVGVEETVTFPTGYMANLAVFSAVMGPFMSTEGKEHYVDGVIFSDQHNHATIVDGCRLTPAKKVIYKHNDLQDLSEEIEKFNNVKHKLIVSESVYSTEGTLTDVPTIVKIAQDTESILMIDDAHGIGVLGNGGGVVSEFHLKNGTPHILMASFDKAMGSTGGFLGGSKQLVEYLKVASRPYIFSSAIPAVTAAATWGVIEKLKNNPGIVKKISDNSTLLRKGLIEAGFKILGNGKTPAVPLYIGDDKKGIEFSKELFKEGLFVPCFRWPAAPANQSRIRISVMATHTEDQLGQFIESAKRVGKILKVIT